MWKFTVTAASGVTTTPAAGCLQPVNAGLAFREHGGMSRAWVWGGWARRGRVGR